MFAEMDSALDTQRGATRELFDELDHQRQEELPAADVERLLQRLVPEADRATCQYIRRQVYATGDDRQVCVGGGGCFRVPQERRSERINTGVRDMPLCGTSTRMFDC